MANTRKSGDLSAMAGTTAPIRTTLIDSDRVTVPVDVRRALDWLGGRSVPVLFELNEPGRVCVLPATEAAMDLIREAMAENPADADDLRVIYAQGNFIQDRLDLRDPVLAHLGFAVDAGKEELFVLARAGLIEIWNASFWQSQVAAATRRQRDVKEALRETVPPPAKKPESD